MNMSSPVYQTFIMEHVEPSARATVASLTSMAWNFGWAFSPTISGLVVSGIIGGWSEVKRLLSGLTRWKVMLRWYFAAAFLLLGPLVIALVSSIQILDGLVQQGAVAVFRSVNRIDSSRRSMVYAGINSPRQPLALSLAWNSLIPWQMAPAPKNMPNSGAWDENL